MTPKRLKTFEENGYRVKKIELMAVTYWLGSSFLVLFERDLKESFFNCDVTQIHCDVCNLSKCRKKGNMNTCRFIE